MCMNVCLHMFMDPVHAWSPWRHKALDTLEIQTVVSHLIWVLGVEPLSSARAVSFLNLGAISPAPS